MYFFRLIKFLFFITFACIPLPGIVIDWILEFIRKLLTDPVYCFFAKIRHLQELPNSKPVIFTCSDPKAKYEKELYVVGTFNEWLRAFDGKIHPYSCEKKMYGLEKKRNGKNVVWEKKIWLEPGYYEFKFITGKNTWIHWHEDSGYQPGSSAAGGHNYKIIVEDD